MFCLPGRRLAHFSVVSPPSAARIGAGTKGAFSRSTVISTPVPPGGAGRRGGRQRLHDRRALAVGAADAGFPVEPDAAADLQPDAGQHAPAGLGRAQADSAVRCDAPAEIQAQAHRRHPAELPVGKTEEVVY